MSERPIRRWVLESVVIIGSILVAFGIDAWWDGLQERDRLNALVDLVRSDITTQISLMEQLNARADSVVPALDELLAIAAGDRARPNRDSLAVLTTSVWRNASSRASLSSYALAQGSDEWGLLPASVISQLADYLEGFTPFDTEVQVRAIERLIEAAESYGGPATLQARDGQALSGDFEGYTSDPRFSTWLWVHRLVLRGERAWRSTWIEKLAAVDRELAAF
jgi:hypothetical protein